MTADRGAEVPYHGFAARFRVAAVAASPSNRPDKPDEIAGPVISRARTRRAVRGRQPVAGEAPDQGAGRAR